MIAVEPTIHAPIAPRSGPHLAFPGQHSQWHHNFKSPEKEDITKSERNTSHHADSISVLLPYLRHYYRPTPGAAWRSTRSLRDLLCCVPIQPNTYTNHIISTTAIIYIAHKNATRTVMPGPCLFPDLNSPTKCSPVANASVHCP